MGILRWHILSSYCSSSLSLSKKKAVNLAIAIAIRMIFWIEWHFIFANSTYLLLLLPESDPLVNFCMIRKHDFTAACHSRIPIKLSKLELRITSCYLYFLNVQNGIVFFSVWKRIDTHPSADMITHFIFLSAFHF